MKEEYSALMIEYLQGRMDKQRMDEFYSWVNDCAENKQRFFEFKAVYDACKDSVKEEDMNRSWALLKKKKEDMQSRKRSFWSQQSSYAAVGLIAVMLTSACFLFFTEKDHGQLTRYIGGDGLEADVVELPDGTQVSLGTKTTFYYATDYGKKNRTVYLEGEAYFEVAKKEGKPFIVKTKEQDVEALGTKFNVTAYPQDSLLITTLLQGSVLLTTAHIADQTILLPNEQFVYNRNTHSAIVQQVEAQQYTDWIRGYYYFPAQSLNAILYRLGHVYGVQFIIESDDLRNRTFTGTFYRGQSLNNIMEIIRLSIPINYKIKDRNITISKI